MLVVFGMCLACGVLFGVAVYGVVAAAWWVLLI